MEEKSDNNEEEKTPIVRKENSTIKYEVKRVKEVKVKDNLKGTNLKSKSIKKQIDEAVNAA